jgi:predicted signal transduction protein with EAL and GGDEF domain
VDGTYKEKEIMHQSDTTANSLTVVSGGAALITFATTWLPVFSMVAAAVAIISGSLAAFYYTKKLRGK